MSYLPPVPEFSHYQPNPFNAFLTDPLPSLMQDVISALQDGGKISTELAINAVLAAVSMACQPHISVLNPFTRMEEHCALNILTLADSGSGKSSISKQVMKPFDAFKAELAEAHLGQLSAWREDYAVWKTTHKALESKLRDVVKKSQCVDEAQAALKSHASAEPTKPVLPALVYNDTSLPALMTGLHEYPCAGLVSDEASNIFDHQLKDKLAFLNKAWDGDVYEFKRSHREPLSIKPTLTVSLMLQPALFLNYMKKDGDKALESGFLSRFLFTDIHQMAPLYSGMMSHRHGLIATFRDDTALPRFHAQIDKLLGKQKEHIFAGKTEKKVLKLSPEAEIYWENLRDSWLALTMPGYAWHYIKPMVLKANTNTLRLAALLSYFSDQDTTLISIDEITRAATIMVWYINHTASWFYQFTDEYKFQKDVQVLVQWIHHKFMLNNGIPFKKNDVIKYGPNKFRRSDKLEPLLDYIMNTGVFAYAQPSPHSAIYITCRMPNGYFAPVAETPQQGPVRPG